MTAPRRGRRAATLALTATLTTVGMTPALAAGDEPTPRSVSYTAVTTPTTLGLGSAPTRTLTAKAAPVAGRIAGDSRADTAVAVSRTAFATKKAQSVYLARIDRFADALAGGALTDGPVLLVPTTGEVPASVLAEIARLSPGEVVALGGPAAVSDDVLVSAAQGRKVQRLNGASRFDTAALISRRAFPSGAREAYVATSQDSSPDAVVGGVLSAGPVLPVPSSGDVPAVIRAEIARLAPRTVYALGGTNAVPATTLAQAAGTRPTGRLAGASRYDTAAAIARHAFPNGAPTAYLARGDVFADAVAGGALTDGPILLVPPASASPSATTALLQATSRALTALRVASVTSLGGEKAVSATTASTVLSAVPTITTSGPVVGVTGTLPAPTPTPTATPTASPTPTATPTPTPTPTPTAPPTPTPTPTPTASVTSGTGAAPEVSVSGPSGTSTPSPTAEAPTAAPSTVVSLPQRYSTPLPTTFTSGYCAKAVTQRWPVDLPSGFSISCVTGDIGGYGSNTLGLTSTSISYSQATDGTISNEQATGTIQIRSDMSDALTDVVIVHELAHAYSYANMTFAQRDAFAQELPTSYPTFNDKSADYATAPAEVWANTQGTCAGYAPPGGRSIVDCSVISRYVPGWRPTSNMPS